MMMREGEGAEEGIERKEREKWSGGRKKGRASEGGKKREGEWMESCGNPIREEALGGLC